MWLRSSAVGTNCLYCILQACYIHLIICSTSVINHKLHELSINVPSLATYVYNRVNPHNNYSSNYIHDYIMTLHIILCTYSTSC